MKTLYSKSNIFRLKINDLFKNIIELISSSFWFTAFVFGGVFPHDVRAHQ